MLKANSIHTLPTLSFVFLGVKKMCPSHSPSAAAGRSEVGGGPFGGLLHAGPIPCGHHANLREEEA